MVFFKNSTKQLFQTLTKVSGSKEYVGSSKNKICSFDLLFSASNKDLAMHILFFCPPERLQPPLPA